ncbi:cathepsin L-like peptidase [Lycorma delicatula]|uniref:cathepsin L-like peptidase n=1 Tax=Lycorma delicatula TaxID=130591 RepID=UPI003F517C5D
MKVLQRCLLCLATILTAAQCVSYVNLIREEWSTFKLQYKKHYGSETEERFRMKIFMDNKNKIAKHNARFEKNQTSFKLALNTYSDMLHHEFINVMNGFNNTMNEELRKRQKNKAPVFMKLANVQVPDFVDWRNDGAVTPIKNQGPCGSCWAFSATGSVEGQHFRQTQNLVSLSEQNLIDCSRGYGNDGCEGGVIDAAFQYIVDNNGIDTEESYPYEARDGPCRFNSDTVGATITSYYNLPQGDEETLKQVVAAIGPVSVAIDAGLQSFQSYGSGVYYDPECSSQSLNHGVLVIGYGTTDDGTDYWLVKNSWGTSWGESGYIRMARNRDNNCGIATAGSYAIV